MEKLAKLLGIPLKDLESVINDDDYGLELRVYPNNQPSMTISYVSLDKLLEAIS